jgi:hypothetical protein
VLPDELPAPLCARMMSIIAALLPAPAPSALPPPPTQPAITAPEEFDFLPVHHTCGLAYLSDSTPHRSHAS